MFVSPHWVFSKWSKATILDHSPNEEGNVDDGNNCKEIRNLWIFQLGSFLLSVMGILSWRFSYWSKSSISAPISFIIGMSFSVIVPGHGGVLDLSRKVAIVKCHMSHVKVSHFFFSLFAILVFILLLLSSHKRTQKQNSQWSSFLNLLQS